MKKMFFTIPLVCAFMGESMACDNNTIGDSRVNNRTIDCISHSGILRLRNVIVQETLSNFGELNINGGRIDGTLSVSGNFTSSGSTIKNINASGDIVFSNNNNITGNTDIIGALTVSNSKFDKQLLITSSRIKLSDGTTTKNIYVRKNNGSNATEYIYLNDSTVNGDITFESGNGIVIANSGSRINGSIIGGTLTQN